MTIGYNIPLISHYTVQDSISSISDNILKIIFVDFAEISEAEDYMAVKYGIVFL